MNILIFLYLIYEINLWLVLGTLWDIYAACRLWVVYHCSKVNLYQNYRNYIHLFLEKRSVVIQLVPKISGRVMVAQ